MISRRIIRTKVLQVSYACQISSEKTIGNAEKELHFSLKKTFDLYHLILQLPVEIAFYAESLIVLRKNKHIPTEEDLNPNLRFVNNEIIKLLGSNHNLNEYLKQTKVGWNNEQDIVKKLYKSLVESDLYKRYMNSPENDLARDKKFIEQLLSEIVLQEEELLLLLEEQSIYWNDDLDFVVSMVIKTIKKLDKTQSSNLLPQYKNKDDMEFGSMLFLKCMANHVLLRKIVEQHTMNWDIDRIACIDQLIMEMAIAEFLYFPSIPTKVTINEYIELSKYYSTDKSHNFINGILDKALKALKEEGKVKKTGRGLIEE